MQPCRIISVLLLSASYFAEAAPEVTLPSGGKIIGTLLNGAPSYLGFRYAESKRWEVATAYNPGAGTTQNASIASLATTNLCFQAKNYGYGYTGEAGYVGVEDCTFMDVHTPSVGATGKHVMVWFHGVWLAGGSGSLPDKGFAINGDVVLVSFNYRVNLLGFFAGAGVPQKIAFRDQIVALQWIQTNIGVFGGNKDSVTIFGISAGATSILIHYKSPLSQGLFHRAIAGSAGNTPGGLYNKVDKTVVQTAQILSTRCLKNSGCADVDCLKAKPILDFAKNCSMFMDFLTYALQPGHFLLGVDGDVVTETVHQATCTGKGGSSKPLIIGSMKSEWSIFQWFGVHLKVNPRMDSSFLADRFLEDNLKGYSEGSPTLRNCAKDHIHSLFNYTKTCAVCHQIGSIAQMEMAGQTRYTLTSQLVGSEPGSGAKFVYIFDADGGGVLEGTHYHDYDYLFRKAPVGNKDCGANVDWLGCGKYVAEGDVTQKILREYWSSFAKTGTPTSITAGVTWKSVDSSMGNLGLPKLDLSISKGALMSNTAHFTDSSAQMLRDIVCGKTGVNDVNTCGPLTTISPATAAPTVTNVLPGGDSTGETGLTTTPMTTNPPQASTTVRNTISTFALFLATVFLIIF